MKGLKLQLHYLQVRKDAKPYARGALHISASNETKVNVECAINTLNWNLKLSTEEKNKLSKYKSKLRAVVNTKINFKSKHKLLIQSGGFIVPLLTSVLSGVVGALMNNNN
jgi:hypothetical protein